MLPKGQYFTDEELLAFAFSSPIAKKTKAMYQESLNGYSEIPKGYYPEARTAKVDIERHTGDETSIVLLASHRTEKSKVISEKKSYYQTGHAGSNSRLFCVTDVLVGESSVTFEELMEELAYRPTEIKSIIILHQEGFDEALQLIVKNDSIFNESPVQLIQPVIVESEDEIPVKSYQFDCTELDYRLITSGTQSIVLEGIGTAKKLEVFFKFGVSYAII